VTMAAPVTAPVAVTTTTRHREWHDDASSEQDGREHQVDEDFGVRHEVPPLAVLVVRRGCGPALHRVRGHPVGWTRVYRLPTQAALPAVSWRGGSMTGAGGPL
jgi:hypothetical protein